MNDYILGVEIGGTKLQLAIADIDGGLLYTARGEVKAEDGASGILLWLEQNARQIISKAREFGGRIAGIGLGFGGPVDSATGRIIISNQIQGWKGFALKDWLQDKFKLPAVVHNDSNAACWGEYKNGFGKGARNFCYMNIGSGIGGGLVINGKLHDGQGFGAAEFGQTYVSDWTINTPGAVKKLELICSGWAIEERLRHPGYVPERSALLKLCGGDVNSITCAMLGAAADSDDFALKEISRVARSVAIALANVLSIVNPERIAMGGGVLNLGEAILAPIKKYLKEYEFISSSEKYEIGKCQLEETIVLVGAVLLFKETSGGLHCN